MVNIVMLQEIAIVAGWWRYKSQTQALPLQSDAGIAATMQECVVDENGVIDLATERLVSTSPSMMAMGCTPAVTLHLMYLHACSL